MCNWNGDSTAGLSWPLDLIAAGNRALFAIKTLDQPNVAAPLVRDAATDLKAFNEAYAAFMSTGA